jgi:hypothetical protein
MTKKQFSGIGIELVRDHPQFAVAGPLVYEKPPVHILRGLCFESSGFSKTDFYVWVFAMPLYIPTDHISFTLGERLTNRGNQGWKLGTETLSMDLARAFREQALPWLSNRNDLSDCVRALSLLANNDPNRAIARALGLFTLGRTVEGMQALDDLMPSIQTESKWQLEILNKANLIKGLALESEQKVHQQLSNWENQTLVQLGLSSAH